VSTSFDAAMPMTPRMPPGAADDQDVVRADGRIRLDRLLRGGDELRFFLLPPQVLVVQLLGEPARFLLERSVGGQQQAGRDVRRAHAAGGIDAGASMKAT
jgi:hypothetical protein